MACVDVNGFFFNIDVGEYGMNSDGRVFRRSSLGKAIENDLLDAPDPKPLPGWDSKGPFSHSFVADKAFLLKKKPDEIFSQKVIK